MNFIRKFVYPCTEIFRYTDDAIVYIVYFDTLRKRRKLQRKTLDERKAFKTGID